MYDVINAPAQSAPGNAAPASAPAPAPSPADFLPEKFRVSNGGGLDLEASARKLAESYAHLEGRVGSGDMPPKAPTEYQITVPEQFREHWREDERFAKFREDALQAGLTQSQMDFVMGKYFAIAPELVQGGVGASVQAVQADLTEAWGKGYDEQLGQAMKAYEAYADPADRGRFDEIMTSPSLAYRILAKIGPELQEAGGIPVTATGGGGQATIKELLTSEANTNPRHPEHAATRAKINAYYARRYGEEPVR